MPYVLPNLNLTCNIKTMPVPNVPSVPTAPYRLNGRPCALVYGRRVNVASTGGTTIPGVPLMALSLLLGKLTDVRGPQDTVSADMVEVPAGSGRWYAVYGVDDIGKGYLNEHRTAAIMALAGSWTAPYP